MFLPKGRRPFPYVSASAVVTVSDAAERLTASAGRGREAVGGVLGRRGFRVARDVQRIACSVTVAVAVTAVSASLPSAERAAARRFAREQGIANVEVCTDELDDPEYVANTGNRCFHCKSALFDAFDSVGDVVGARMALGTNLDDLGDHRPARPLRHSAVIAPMVDAELTKADVRAISAEWVWTRRTSLRRRASRRASHTATG